MDNEENNETANELHPEPIETSVVALDAGMIIVQPIEVEQIDNDDGSNEQAIIIETIQTVEPTNEPDVTPSRKKRKRSLSRKSESPKKPPPPPLNNDDVDGSTCSICLDTWESKGEHRLVSLKCGHLFGDSCIKRWIQECTTNSKCCPTCKSKAMPRDIRPLYAKRVVVVDKSEEYRLQELLNEEKTKNVELQGALSTIKLEMAVKKEEYAKLEAKYTKLAQHGVILETQSTQRRQIMYNISMHKNVEINREGGCRAITFGRRIQTLIMSQKATNALFPGYGVRFLSAHSLQPTIFFRISPKPIRDLSLDSNDELLSAAAQDVNAYVYSVTNRSPVATMTPSESQIWATSFDKVRQNHLHLGTQQGITYTYDMRNCMAYIEQFTTPGDFSPVIGVESIPLSDDFPFGGFIVCKLQSLWFYEYTASSRTIQTKLVVDGPFISINLNEKTSILLIGTKPTSKYPKERLIIANLTKIDEATVLRTVFTILGSQTQPKMTRSTQINIGEDSIVASYIQENKSLTTWNAENGNRMQGFKVEDCILDMCPMYINNNTFLATLSESRCRIFQLNSI